MTQAKCVHSTPPTNTSARHSRRSILGAIAGSAAAAGGIAAGEGINLSANTINVLAPKTPSKEITPSQGIEADPIYAAIEAHRKADAAADVAFAESSRLYRLANEMVGPSKIEVPNMVEPGTTVKVLCYWDVERVIPHEQYPDLNEHYCRLLEERSAARFDIHGDTDELTDGLANAAWDARDQFAETVPTTLPGLLAMIVYANELAEQDPGGLTDGESHRTLLQTLATAAKALIGRPA